MVEFRKTSTLSEFEMTDGQSLVAGNFQEIAVMKTPAQQIRFFGNGAIINGVDDRGTLKLTIKDNNGNVIKGTARLVVADANKVIRNFRREDRSEDLVNGIRVGKDNLGAKEDSYLIIEYNPDSNGTLSVSKSSGSIPITIRTL